MIMRATNTFRLFFERGSHAPKLQQCWWNSAGPEVAWRDVDVVFETEAEEKARISAAVSAQIKANVLSHFKPEGA